MSQIINTNPKFEITEATIGLQIRAQLSHQRSRKQWQLPLNLTGHGYLAILDKATITSKFTPSKPPQVVDP
ncbi:CDP-diacylglycerol pyrophosphatase [Bradyrhizobium sp. USDA 4472]